MAPTTRSNKAGMRAIQSNGIIVNARGFPALPNELYMEILSYLPPFPIPDDVWLDEKRDPYRQLTLYHLSQTCRSLRKFFLRYAWERIEVFWGMWTPKGKLCRNSHKRLVGETLRQLETVVERNPDLRKCVTTVDLTIPIYSHDSVLPVIAQNVSLLPDLHSLRIIFEFDYAPISKIFSKYRYRKVHTLNLNDRGAHRDIFLACPYTKHLSFHRDGGDLRNLLNLLPLECAGNIEKLGLITHLGYLRLFVCHLPRLRDISLDCQLLRRFPNAFEDLVSIPLQTIRLRLDDWSQSTYFHVTATPAERQSWIDSAMRILAKCPQNKNAKRLIIVVNDDKTVDVYHKDQGVDFLRKTK